MGIDDQPRIHSNNTPPTLIVILLYHLSNTFNTPTLIVIFHPYCHITRSHNLIIYPFSYLLPNLLANLLTSLLTLPCSLIFFHALFSSGLWPFATVGWPLQEKDPHSEFNR